MSSSVVICKAARTIFTMDDDTRLIEFVAKSSCACVSNNFPNVSIAAGAIDRITAIGECLLICSPMLVITIFNSDGRKHHAGSKSPCSD